MFKQKENNTRNKEIPFTMIKNLTYREYFKVQNHLSPVIILKHIEQKFGELN